MNHRPLARPLVAILTAGALVLAGCSNMNTVGTGSVDVGLVPLRPGDLPSEWTGKAHSSSNDADTDASNKKLEACLGAKDTSGNRIRQVYSMDYSKDESSIASRASLYTSSADVDENARQFTNPKLKSCTEEQFKEQAAKGLSSGSLLGTPELTIIAGNNGGPSNVVATLTVIVRVTVQGQSVTIYETSVAIRGDRIQASIEFVGIGAPIDKATMTTAIAAVAARAGA